MSYPSEVLDNVREVLLEHMTAEQEHLPWCAVVRALYVGQSGRILAENELCDGDPPIGLQLTTVDGSEVRLTVTAGVRANNTSKEGQRWRSVRWRNVN